jgi:hypothetical protein
LHSPFYQGNFAHFHLTKSSFQIQFKWRWIEVDGGNKSLHSLFPFNWLKWKPLENFG